MKPRLRYLALFFIIILTTFLMMKVVFMLYNAGGHDFGVADIFAVLWHGLPLDLSTTSYLTGIPLFFCILSLWVVGTWLRPATKIYCYILAPLLAVTLVADTVLYKFWQFKLDATIFNYIDDPKNVFASVSPWFILLGILAIVALATLMLLAFKHFVISRVSKIESHQNKFQFLVLLLIGGVMFLLVRGGVGRSTMNVGHVYYSQNQFLNHSAVNPVFSLVSSSFKVQDFEKLYNFYDTASCDSIFAQLRYDTISVNTDTLLTTTRPNILLIIMEGCGSVFMEPQSYGVTKSQSRNITPNLWRLADEGIYFSRCYANSFRTDRGLVCTLSGYPAFPDISVMKLAEKARTLPSIARTLAANDYSTEFLYGGDINFTNTKGYLLSTGYQKARGYETFPVSVRHSHSWGVQDHIALDTLYNIVRKNDKAKKRKFVSCLTLSSHEDWQVPYSRIKDDQIANAMAYLDDCIGKLVTRLKASPAWNDLLLIILPDHSIPYPDGITEANPERNRIPIIWAGGAVRKPRLISTLCNQTDLAATLLGQLGLPHSDFSFSRDVLSSTYTYPCAVHTFSGGITFIDSTGYIVKELGVENEKFDTSGQSSMANRQWSIKLTRAYLQKTMEDFAKR